MRVFRSCSLWWSLCALALTFVMTMPRGASAQSNPDPFGFKFNSGQSVQPIFEGWSKNPDGSYAMWFGYLNRNYVETFEVPIGPNNKIESAGAPGTLDRGQPTFFNTRIQRKVFSVNVPKEWPVVKASEKPGKNELVWTVTANGVTEKAVGWLQPEWEIDPIYGGKSRNAESLKNKAPVMTLDVRSTVALPETLTLNAAVQDDGLPTPRKGPRQAAIGQETPPTLKPLPDQPEIPVNVPTIGAGRGRGQPPQGLAVNWFVYRGPAAVTFEQTRVPVKDGKASTTATFTKPGTYVLRARADDGELTDQKEITITVTGSAQQQ